MFVSQLQVPICGYSALPLQIRCLTSLFLTSAKHLYLSSCSSQPRISQHLQMLQVCVTVVVFLPLVLDFFVCSFAMGSPFASQSCLLSSIPLLFCVFLASSISPAGTWVQGLVGRESVGLGHPDTGGTTRVAKGLSVLSVFSFSLSHVCSHI